MSKFVGLIKYTCISEFNLMANLWPCHAHIHVTCTKHCTGTMGPLATTQCRVHAHPKLHSLIYLRECFSSYNKYTNQTKSTLTLPTNLSWTKPKHFQPNEVCLKISPPTWTWLNLSLLGQLDLRYTCNKLDSKSVYEANKHIIYKSLSLSRES